MADVEYRIAGNHDAHAIFGPISSCVWLITIHRHDGHMARSYLAMGSFHRAEKIARRKLRRYTRRTDRRAKSSC